ncbi:TetR/AcrR family transcriptional regulator [Vibrio superstes]|uniref:TetR family transcriptional regulator n=1 Tax=Vibrio superstes NBRC 103154 TaxID=1219062 RepID=A0A511QVT9_9VIBR|nr:TetR/AcrR family transcriptional regulator [Vibrio superstes]GEM81493.1 TetR family transcriptional regulator [Vibrio superstes NBRC 103154]
MAGRKRTFDKNVALDKAMRLFWNNGYAGTSISNLTSELGINSPSLYAAFGNKDQLFKEVLEHYLTQYAEPHYQHLTTDSEADLQTRLHACFHGLIQLFTDNDTPLGCLLVKSVNESDSIGFPDEATVYLRDCGSQTKLILMTLFNSGINNEDLPKNTTIEMLVDYLLSVSYGLAVQARTGQKIEVLAIVLDYALATLPYKKNDF